MTELKVLARQAKDILSCRIEAVLDDMSLTALCSLPEEEPMTVESFVSLTEQTCKESAECLARYGTTGSTWLSCLETSYITSLQCFY